MSRLTPEDDAVLRMLAGAKFGPKASLTLPSGVKLTPDEANVFTAAYADDDTENPDQVRAVPPDPNALVGIRADDLHQLMATIDSLNVRNRSLKMNHRTALNEIDAQRAELDRLRAIVARPWWRRIWSAS